MSKIKRSLPETFSLLNGSELDGSPNITIEPSILDWALIDLQTAALAISKSKETLGQDYLSCVETVISTLQAKVNAERVPF